AYAVRHRRAAAVALVGEAMVAAHHPVAFEPAHRQRQQPVPAGVLERAHAAVATAEQDDALVADGAGEQLATDLHVPGGRIPRVERKRLHANPPGYRLYTDRSYSGLQPAVNMGIT